MKVAVLVSGSGTNLQALIDAAKRGELAPAQLCGVICNRPGAPALDRARRAEVPAITIDHRDYSDRESFDRALMAELDRLGAEAVVLAGFMRILSAGFVDAYRHRIINTHPALCPAFPGIRAPQQALDAGVRVTGCTVHFVDAGVDTGPIIFQRAVDVRDDDNADTLHDRIRVHEHELLPKAVQLLAAGKLTVEGRRVRIAD